MRYASPGTVSHGTLRTADLIPAFTSALDTLNDRNCYTNDGDELALVALSTRATDLLASIERAQAADEHYYDSDAADEDLSTLIDILGEYAPAGHYFGAHEGDGSDFGFWPCDDDEGPDVDAQNLARMAGQASTTVPREDVRTIVTALYCHARHCERLADEAMNRRSSTRTYEANAGECESARAYRDMASECDAVRERLNDFLNTL
jgi:hypothetical protein